MVCIVCIVYLFLACYAKSKFQVIEFALVYDDISVCVFRTYYTYQQCPSHTTCTITAHVYTSVHGKLRTTRMFQILTRRWRPWTRSTLSFSSSSCTRPSHWRWCWRPFTTRLFSINNNWVPFLTETRAIREQSFVYHHLPVCHLTKF